MFASSFYDVVLGIDIHWEFVPPPMVPTPFPNPFIGIVFDPMGLACGLVMSAVSAAWSGTPMTGPVFYYTAFPATNTGTEAKAIPGHMIIPPGVSWAPMPKTPKPKIHPKEPVSPPKPVVPDNDAVAITGSKTVLVGGSNACRLADIMLSCSEPLRLPSSLIIAVPKGLPILIGGPPSLDVMAAVLASLRTRFVSDSLHALVSRLPFRRLRNTLHWVVCFFTGHPVDVASGKVVTDFVDADLPGPLPLKITRQYSSAFGSRASPIGCGWSWSLDQAIWRERGKVVFLAEDGREIEFDTFDLADHTMCPGQEVRQPVERLVLRCLDGGAWEVVSPDGGIREFAPVAGRTDGRAMIRRQRSYCGYHQISFEYDRRGLLVWVQDSAGRHIGLDNDQRGRVVALKLPHPDMEGWVVHRRYSYDEAGDLVQVHDALEASWRFEYVTHLLTRETDRNGLSFYFLYDGLGEDAWCIRTWGDGGIYDHSIQYDKKNKITFVTDSLGNTKRYHMNLIGLVEKIVDARGGVTTYAYNPDTLQKVAEVDPIGRETRYNHDSDGNVVETVRPDGVSVRVEYGLFGRPSRAWDAIGGEWTWTHDARGRLTTQTDPLGHATRYRYEGAFLAELVDPAGYRTLVSFDHAGNLAWARLPNGGERRWSHDRRGQLVDDVDPKGNHQRMFYDLEGRVQRVEEPDGNTRLLTLDPEGNPRRAQDVHHDIFFEYGGRNQLVARQEAGATVRFDYNTEQNLTALTNEHGFVHRFVHDAKGDTAEEIGFDGLRRVFTRDLAGQVVRVELPEGRQKAYAYDEVGNVTTIHYHDDTKDTFGWRADGALVLAANEDVEVRWERDPLGRVLREWQGPHWVASEYDARGDRVAMWSSLGADQQISRDPMGDVTGLVADRGRFVARVERDLLGQELRRWLPGGVESRWECDSVGRPQRHVVTGGGGQVHRDVAYTWAPGLRLRCLEDVAQGRTEYGHDAWGNLAWSRQPDGKVEIRSPDAVGNLFKTWDRSDRKYGAAGQILEAMTHDGTVRYDYDALGNLVRKSEPKGMVWTFAWDARGRLRAATTPAGAHVLMRYDALGRRVVKRSPSQSTVWIWDGHRLLHEGYEASQGAAIAAIGNHANTGDDITTMVHGVRSWREFCGPIESFELWSFFSDHNMTVVLSDAIGTPCLTFQLEGGGRSVDGLSDGPRVASVEDPSRPMGCNWRSQGQVEDEDLSLYYNWHRYYDPVSGSYISPDPIFPTGGIALYAYCPDPLVSIDPFGLIVVYHYTSKKGYNAIRGGRGNGKGAWFFKASTPATAKNHPHGVYVTTKPPSELNPGKMGLSSDKSTHFFAFDVPEDQLKSIPGDRGDYVKYSPDNLDVQKEQQVDSGKCK